MYKSMKHFLNKLSKSVLAIFALLFSNGVYAAAEASTSSSDFKFDANTILAACAVLLLIVIFALGNTLRSTILFYHERRKKESKNAGKILSLIIVALLFSALPALAQEATLPQVSEPTTMSEEEVTRWILFLVIGVEIVIIFTFTKLIRFFAGVDMQQSSSVERKAWFSIDLEKIWNKMNKFKPIEEEASIDTGHSYDGIRELNNVTPPWFIAGFVISILFAIGYMWRYHVAESAPLQIEEYNISVADAKIRLDEYLKTQANNVDENTVVMLDNGGIAAGQALFAANCVACHGDKGQGAAVGPNLSDNYWLHKGGISDVFKSIKYGWQEKGMKSWKEDFSSLQIAQLSSYIMSLKGSNPAGAKEPQGELYEDVVVPVKTEGTVDSTKK
jgi:cytochrome c oxidase cbb3-type subunit III